MAKNKFLDLSGLEYFKDKIISIIEENELVTSVALIDLNEKLDLKLDKSDLPIEKGEGENSVQLKNTENKANGWGSIALFGYGNTAGASNTFVGGDTNYAYGTGSVVIGGKNNTIEGTGEFSAIVGGDENLVSGDRAFAFGHNVKVYSQYGAAFGYDNTVSGLSGFAEGTRNTVSAHGAHAEGAGTTAGGEFSHSEGFETVANGVHAHSEGYQTQALQVDAHAEGHLSIANEHAAHAEGWQTYAGGWSTHAEGIETITSNHNGEHAQGKYNISNPGTIHSIGVGSDSSNRKNAVEVKDDGKHYILGIGGYDGTNIDTATDVASALNQLNEITLTTSYLKDTTKNSSVGSKGGGSKLYSVELDNNGDMCVALTDESKIWEYSELKTDLDNQNNITAGFNNTNVIDGNSAESKKSLHMPSSEFGSMNAVGSFMQFGSELWKCQLVAGSRGYDYIRNNNNINKKTPEGLYFRKYGEISKGVTGYGWTPWREIVSIDNTGKLCITHLDSEYHYSGGPTSVNNTLTIPYTTNFSNSIKVNNTNVSLEGHTHTIELGDGDNKTTDTLEAILESFSALIQKNTEAIGANAESIGNLAQALADHGSGTHITTGAQSFTGAKTFNSAVRIRAPYNLVSSVIDNSNISTTTLNANRTTAGGLAFTNSSTSSTILAAMGVLSTVSSNTLSNQIGDTSLGTAFVIDSSYPVLIRALGGLRIANVPGESVSKISFGDSPNNYISYPEQDFLVINSNQVLEISSNIIDLNSSNIFIDGSSSALTSDTSSLSLTTGKDNLILNAEKAVTIPTQTHITYVKDHGTITSSQTINLEAGCLNKIVINANCSLTLGLTNPNISQFNEYSAHCIISCGTGVTTTNTITLPAMCGTAQTIQYSKTSIIELDIIAYPNSSNGSTINYLTSWQYHRL